MHPVRAGTEIILGLRQKCLFEFRRTRNDAQSFGSGVEAQYQFNGWRKPPALLERSIRRTRGERLLLVPAASDIP